MATKTPIRPPTIRDPQDQFQREVNRAVKQANTVQQDSRTYVRNVSLNTGQVKVKHGLGRIPVAFVVTDKQIPCDVWRSIGVQVTSDYITLECSTTATVSLMFW